MAAQIGKVTVENNMEDMMAKSSNGAWLALGVAGAAAAAGVAMRRSGSMARSVKAKNAPESMVNHYLVTALWSSSDDNDDPMDGKYGVKDFTVAARQQAAKDCDAFVLACEEAGLGGALFQNGYDEAGHDFWLTRNGHGAGFWDGDYGDDGDALTEIAKRFREVNLYANRGKVGME